MSEVFIPKESGAYLFIQNLKNKADKACMSGNKAACGRWVYQLLDVLDTRLPDAIARPLAIVAVNDPPSASTATAPAAVARIKAP